MVNIIQSQQNYDPVERVAEWQLQQSVSDHAAEGDPSQSQVEGQLSNVARLCASLLDLFREANRTLAEQSSASDTVTISLERSRSALVLWSDGHGIAQGDLDNTFAKSRKLRSTTARALLHIGEILIERLIPHTKIWSNTLRDLCICARSVMEDAAGAIRDDADDESDTSSSGSSDTYSDDNLDEIAEDVRVDARCLTGLHPLLSNPIQDPDIDPESRGFVNATWSPTKLYADKIEARFCKADKDLIMHLARVSYERYLRCQGLRDSRENQGETNLKLELAGTIFAASDYRDSGIGTSIAPTLSYAETLMSYNHEGRSVTIPPLPVEAKTGSAFSCIACGQMVRIKNNSAWKRHIYLDLQPYLCIDITCTHSNATFPTREKWVSHLSLDHSMEPEWKSIACLLCGENTGYGKMIIIQHLAKHLEEVSLSALPANVSSNSASEVGSEVSESSSKSWASADDEEVLNSNPQGSAPAYDVPVVMADAISYLEKVKDIEPKQHEYFLDVMKEFADRKLDTRGVMSEVAKLFHGSPTLIHEFNTFLPTGYKMVVEYSETDNSAVTVRGSSPLGGTRPLYKTGETEQKEPVDFNVALSFVQKVKSRFKETPVIYKRFLEIIQRYQQQGLSITDMYAKVNELFQLAPDLLEGFKEFLPDSATSGDIQDSTDGRNRVAQGLPRTN
ncbi:hypothetical protein B0H63DRAFT_562026 [Podospora didyma]|uniref:Oxidoreductase acuF-like C2H2 type zinc-finger domain-containing protein n=1 Tax=Podospora didyma TaxID=330526 RepID=A0AAE0KJR9_9PEZI|nr:hypothetical protein B0H63DRAFT_562026 [Podospora didyma]